MIKWNVSAEDHRLLVDIAARGVQLAKRGGIAIKQQELLMDLAAAHANGCPLRLAELAAADPSNFGHDVFGIRRHIDRETGRLLDCFTPRFAVRGND